MQSLALTLVQITALTPLANPLIQAQAIRCLSMISLDDFSTGREARRREPKELGGGRRPVGKPVMRSCPQGKPIRAFSDLGDTPRYASDAATVATPCAINLEVPLRGGGAALIERKQEPPSMSNHEQHGNREAKKPKLKEPKTIAAAPSVKEVFHPGKPVAGK